MVEIQRVSLRDLDEVAPLFDAYRQFYAQPPDIVQALAFLRDRLSAEESVILVARQIVADGAGSAVGFVQIYPIFSSIGCGRALILNDLYVDPAQRRCGVGRKLMEAATAYAKSIGAQYIELSTHAGNAQAQALYESVGYKRDTDFHHYVMAL